MSLLERKSATKAVSNFTIKPYLLPAYIILSALFILFVAYSYFKSAVYQVGIQQGAYNAALEIANASATQEACQNGITIPGANGQTTILVNAGCPQFQPQQAPSVKQDATVPEVPVSE